ncbi:hypothetical protein K1I93_09715, partial [Streptococcus australis]|nr:hypothetical protein [Streptococcus australis]
MADKIEKGCLKCVGVFGGIAPSVSLLGGIGQLGLDAWKAAELVTAKKLAAEAGAAAGLKAGDALGMDIVTAGLKSLKVHTLESGIFNSFVNTKHYTEVRGLVDIIDTQINAACSVEATGGNEAICQVRVMLG